jgi:hypothetical protein
MILACVLSIGRNHSSQGGADDDALKGQASGFVTDGDVFLPIPTELYSSSTICVQYWNLLIPSKENPTICPFTGRIVKFGIRVHLPSAGADFAPGAMFPIRIWEPGRPDSTEKLLRFRLEHLGAQDPLEEMLAVRSPAFGHIWTGGHFALQFIRVLNSSAHVSVHITGLTQSLIMPGTSTIYSLESYPIKPASWFLNFEPMVFQIRF